MNKYQLAISQNYNERKALDSIMERYFMLGDKDHQFFDITAAAYVSILTT